MVAPETFKPLTETFTATFFSIFLSEKLGDDNYLLLSFGSDTMERIQGYKKPLARSVRVAMNKSVGGFFLVPCYTMKPKNQIKDDVLRVSTEDGAIRVRMLTPEEEKQFLRTHPNFKSQILSVEDIERLAKMVPNAADPSTKSLTNGE